MSDKRKVIGIALITAVAILGDAMLFIVLPLYWQDFGLTAIWQVGVLLSINRFVRLPITPLVGLFYSKFDIRTGVLISVICASLSTLSYGLLPSFWLLLLARVLWGISWSLIKLGGMLTVVALSTEVNRGHYMGLYNGLWGLGGLVGMLAGGFLVDQLSIPLVTTLFSFAAVVVFPFIFKLVPKNSKKAEDESTARSHFPEKDKRSLLHPYIILVIITGGTMGFITMGIFASTLSPLIEQSYDAHWSLFGIVIGAATLAGMIQAIRWAWDPLFAPMIGSFVDKSRNKNSWILVPLLLGGVTFLIIGRAESFLLLLITIMFFQLVSTSLVTITDTLAGDAAARSNPIKMMTLYTVAVDLGAAIGPLVSFIIIDLYGLSAVFYLSSMVMILVSITWIVFNFYTNQRVRHKNIINNKNDIL
ncbi:MFS transporter [Oceanobacillus sp. J11TS1]|uniref:MFS transporter n=1 Tax=Oceanobacillus sp. J11TS1 TaxID=2807191 RepID=UPI001B18AE18|nr:MFS transporter [Oceanobacillus sp. J11TS1]GIO23343.1 MFS transporter [Oceanobacillus sp. J11TS1]